MYVEKTVEISVSEEVASNKVDEIKIIFTIINKGWAYTESYNAHKNINLNVILRIKTKEKKTMMMMK